MQRLGVLVLVSAGLAACTSTKAATPIERPTLEVPPAPPRVIDPAPAPEADRSEPIIDPVPPVPPPPTSKPRPQSREPKETPKPEPKPEVPAAAVDPAATPPPMPAPPVLRTPATANVAAVEKQIRDTLLRAGNMLKKVDYRHLSAERKKAYGEAQDFMLTAEARITASNFESAKEFAEKAERLAKELQQGR